MSKGVNKVTLIGNLGREPKIFDEPNCESLAIIDIATDETCRHKCDEDVHESATWHRAVLYGDNVENARQYLHKGSMVYIEGELRNRKWQDRSGHIRYTTEVVVGIGGAMRILDTRPPKEGHLKFYQLDCGGESTGSTFNKGDKTIIDLDDITDDIPC